MTIHEEHEAFALLDDAIDALFAIARDPDSDPNDVPVDAVLIVGVQRVDNDDAPIGYVELLPRAGAQPAATRRLIGEAGRLLNRAPPTATTSHDRDLGRVTPTPRPSRHPWHRRCPP